jgi:hypothetical protein
LNSLETFTTTHQTFEIEGELIPKGGVWEIQFQCADAIGTFYVKIISIVPMNVSGGDGPNTFKITNITQAQMNQASTHCLVGLFPTNTTKTQVIADANAIWVNGGSPSYIVAGENDPQPPEISAPYSISGSLLSKDSDWKSAWRGGGEFHIWFLLQNGSTWNAYRTTNPVTLTAGGSYSGNAQTEFKSQ